MRGVNAAPLLSNQPCPAARGDVPRIGVTARIGVEYAKEWKDAPLRFYEVDSAAESRC
jgi:hypothetical protein